MSDRSAREKPLIAVVGPCASGKSTLVTALEKKGFNARQVAQEHSHVPSMWEQITKPDLLIYLHASFEECTKRKQLDWNPGEYQIQVERLAHARERCDLFIDTTELPPGDVVRLALDFVRNSLAS